MARIYLIRHGETDGNKGKTIQGCIDLPLNAKGIEQAEKMAAYFKDIPLDAIYCSSMGRARRTAQELAKVKGLDITPMDELREITFGEWEGVDFGDIERRWPEGFKTYFVNPMQWTPPGGETLPHAQERSFGALMGIMEKEGHDKNIAIVCHGGIIRVLICTLLGLDLSYIWRLSVANVSVSSFNEWNGKFISDTINDYHFLNEKKEFSPVL